MTFVSLTIQIKYFVAYESSQSIFHIKRSTLRNIQTYIGISQYRTLTVDLAQCMVIVCHV